MNQLYPNGEDLDVTMDAQTANRKERMEGDRAHIRFHNYRQNQVSERMVFGPGRKQRVGAGSRPQNFGISSSVR